MRTAIFLIALFLFACLDSTAGSAHSFTYDAPCLACNTPAGLVAGNIAGATATLTWDAVDGATQYTVEIQDEQNIPSTFHIETKVNSNSYNVSGLQAGVKYKFKVRTHCGGDKSDWSAWVFFSGGNNGGGSGACDVPTGLAASVTGATATLTWNAVSGALGYSLEVEDEQNSPSVFHLKDTASANVYTLSGLQTGVSYKFKVRTRCTSGQSDWSAWQFLNGKGGSNNGSPAGGCANPTGMSTGSITAISASLNWNAVAGVNTYTVEIERMQVGAAPWKVKQTIASTTYLLTGLSPETRYKFKVRSNCPGGGHGAWSAWTKFKTSATAVVNNPAEDRDAARDAVATSFGIQVYPNPVQTDATIRLDRLSAEPVTLRLFNATGHLVQEQRIQPENGSWEGRLSVGDLPKGVYLLQARTAQHLQTSKVIINH